ncbi:unnamed protein product [Schistosoma guineensis]|nr:unnamed protein product [Schistosoma guineensis]
MLWHILFILNLILSLTFSILETEKLPHFALRSFLSTNDIVYFNFPIPQHTFVTKLSISVTFHGCSPENISLTLRSGSFPVVRPFDVPVPNGVLEPRNSYSLNIPIKESFNLTVTSDDCGTYSQFHVKSINLRNAANIDINIHGPVVGMWYIGAYMTTSFQKECIAWLLPSVRHDISNIDGHISYNYNPQLRHNQSISYDKPFIEGIYKLPSRTIFGSHAVEKLFHRKKRRKPSYHSVVHSTADQPTHSSLIPPSSSTESININPYHIRTLSFLMSPFDLELAPMEGRLYLLTIMDVMTSIDVILEDCRIVTPIAPSHENISVSKHSNSTSNDQTKSSLHDNLPNEIIFDSSACPIIIDGSVEALPSSLSYLHQSQGFRVSTTDKPEHGIGFSSNVGSPSSKTFNYTQDSSIQRIFRLLGLRGSQINHYLYILNQASHVAVYSRLVIIPKFGCSLMKNSRNFHHNDYLHQQSQKISLQFLSMKHENKSFKDKINFNRTNNINYRFFLSISLLPWINSDWPELTPEYGEKKWLKTYSSINTQQLIISNFGSFNFNHPGYQDLPLCYIWPTPTRVHLPVKFTYHFAYQPDFGRYASLLHLKPWHIVVIPITLNSVMDMSSVLEIALQLNALNVSWQFNETYREPLPRQIILHGCFARHLTNTPKGFTDIRQCPLWIRLATDHGLAVSVAHAISSAASKVFASSQSPRRSERPPNLDTSFNEGVDRSFLFFPYPTPGRWYLSLYPECYTEYDALCGLDQSAVIDVSLIIRSTPCINNHCRQIGEGATIAPSRLLYPNELIVNTSRSRDGSQRWRPPWWSSDGSNKDNTNKENHHFKYNSPFTYVPVKKIGKIPGEGICINLFQRSIHVSTCACPIGYGGLGCMPLPIDYFKTFGLYPNRQILSYDALILALSNFGFIPAILLTVIHRLWIPALVYGYTFLFSTLYHICDTDSNLIPGYNVMHTPNYGSSMLYQSTNIAFKMNIPISSSSSSKSFIYSQFTSSICVLPVDTLSFCDFFGGIFSIWISTLTIAAIPMKYTQCAFIIGALLLTVAVQIVRYSIGIILVPLIIGLIIILYSWINFCIKLKSLFPPIQWWIISFIPGVLFATIGASMFFHGQSTHNYTKHHSIWHILIGLSLACFLPWPFRWRIALSPIISVHIPLSCGNLPKHYDYNSDLSNTNSLVIPVEIIQNESENLPGCNNVLDGNRDVNLSNEYMTLTKLSYKSIFINKLTNNLNKLTQFTSKIYQKFTLQIDKQIQLNFLLDPLCTRWPKLKWILPYGYKPKNVLSADTQTD